MELNLTKPIAFFDLETTGLNISKDKIIEISILKVSPDNKEEIYTQRINPIIPISEESTGIHGITNNDLVDCPTFADVAEKIKLFIGDADLAGYNSNRFDIPFLLEELLNHKVELEMEGRRYIDVQTIFHKMEQRTLTAAYKFYCNKEIIDAHSAEADTIATYEVLKAQLDRYPEVENDMDFLFDFTQVGKHRRIDFVGRLALNEDNKLIYNFGKNTGKTVAEVFAKEPGYHRWILDNDFPLFTKSILKKETDQLIAAQRQQKAAQKQQSKTKQTENISNNQLDQLKNKFNT